MDARFLALPRSCHVENLDAVFFNELPNRSDRIIAGPRNVETGLSVFLGEADGPERAACDLGGEGEDQGAVADPNVPFSALQVPTV